MDEPYLFLLNADGSSDDERLEFMRTSVNESFQPYNDRIGLFSSFLENESLDRPALVFAHKGPWNSRGGIESAFEKWKDENWKLLYLVVYSGAERLSEQAIEPIKETAKEEEVGKHVYVIERRFPPEDRFGSEALRSFVDAFVDHYAAAEAVRPDDSDLHAALADAMRQVNSETRVDFLPALSILCQGYLAVHADAEAAQSALDQMEWSPNLLEDVDVTAKQEEVASEKYWRVADGTDLAEQVEEEWMRDSEDGWEESIKPLIASISQNPFEDPGPATVATAYCTLAERLGGTPCR